MASIYKRKNKDGTTVWCAVVRIKGYPTTVCYYDERKQVVIDWASDIERQIKAGQYKFDHHNQMRTFADLSEHFLPKINS